MALITKVPGLIVDETSNFTFANANVTGNLTSGNANLGNLATANYVAGTLTTALQPNITQVGTLANLTVTGNVTAGAIKTNSLLYANGEAYAIGGGITIAGTNSQVQFNSTGSFGASANFTFNTSTNTLSVDKIAADGGLLSNIAASNVTGTVANATFATTAGTATSATSATTAGTVTTNAQPNITSVGTLSGLTVNGDIAATNANLGNAATANYFIGSGANLSNLQASNITGTVANATFATTAGTATSATTATTATSATTAGTVTTAAQPNITSLGTLTSVTVTGNVTADYFIGSGNNLSNLQASNVTGTVANATFATTAGTATSATSATTAATVTTNAQPNITSVGTLSSLAVNGEITSTNANLGNAATANFFIGSGANLSNIQASNVTGTVANATFATTAGTATSATSATTAGTVTTNAQPNITSTGTLSGLTVNGDITSNNVVVNASTASTSKTTGALTVAGGVGINNDLTVGNSITVDGGAYGNVVVTQFGSVFAHGSGPNPRAIYQARAADGIAGLGMQAYSGLNGQIYSNTGFTFTTGATVRDKDFPTGGTTRATIDSTGLIVTGIANISGNISSLNANLGNAAAANYFVGSGNNLSNIQAANITGAVANATYAITSGTAYSVAGANVSGEVTFAATANAVEGANVSGQVTSAIVAGTVYTNAQPNITSTGTLTSLAITGNVTAGNANLGNAVTANFFSGNGSLLTGVTTTTAVTVSFNAQPNITSVGTLTTLTVGNATANTVFGNGSITAAGNITFTGANVSLGAASNLRITGGTTGYFLQTDGAGNLSWASTSGGAGTVSGSNTQIQFNDGGLLGASANLAFDKTSKTLSTDRLVAINGANLGSVANVYMSGGSANQILKTDGAGNLTWIAQPVTTIAVDNFTGTGSQTAFTLSVTPNSINQTVINYNGAFQLRSAYSLSGAVITFSEPPESGSAIEITTTQGMISGSGAFTTRTYTGDGTTTAYTVTTGTTVSSVLVTENGLLQTPTTDYTISGSTLTFTVAPGTGIKIQIRELALAVATYANNLGSVSNITITGGANGQVLTSNGASGVSWQTVAAAESVSPFLLMGA